MCATTRDTLLYYDEVGVLKPAKVGENGYRYYTAEQFFDFDIIDILREAKMPLSQIAQYLQSCDLHDASKMLKAVLKSLKQEQKRLKRMEKSIYKTLECLQEGLQCTIGKIEILHQPQQYLLVTPTKFQKNADEKTILAAFRHHIDYYTQQELAERLQTGAILLKEEMEKGCFVERYYFTPTDHFIENARIFVRPQGWYAVKYHQGSYDTFEQAYQIFYEELKEKGYQVIGDLYEDDVVDHVLCTNSDSYICKLSIQIQKE